jgi:hypothetical protein
MLLQSNGVQADRSSFAWAIRSALHFSRSPFAVLGNATRTSAALTTIEADRLPEYHEALVEHLLDTNDTSAALRQLQVALKAFPSHGSLANLAASVHHLLNDTNAAHNTLFDSISFKLATATNQTVQQLYERVLFSETYRTSDEYLLYNLTVLLVATSIPLPETLLFSRIDTLLQLEMLKRYLVTHSQPSLLRIPMPVVKRPHPLHHSNLLLPTVYFVVVDVHRNSV